MFRCFRIRTWLRLEERPLREYLSPRTENKQDHPRPHPSPPLSLPPTPGTVPLLGAAGHNTGGLGTRGPEILRPISSRHARLLAFLPGNTRKRSAPQLPSLCLLPHPGASHVVSSTPVCDLWLRTVFQGKASPDLLAYYYSHTINILCLQLKSAYLVVLYE